MITDILIMANVDNNAAPPSTWLNIDVSMVHAVVKSGERKNTQVTFTRKNVSNASINFEEDNTFNKFPPLTPCITSDPFSAGIGDGLFAISWITFSPARNNPCRPPHTTNVQLAPCHKP